MTVLVRFLRAKRYPHPNGPKRAVDTVWPVEKKLARQWAKAGLVELVDQPKPGAASTSKRAKEKLDKAEQAAKEAAEQAAAQAAAEEAAAQAAEKATESTAE